MYSGACRVLGIYCVLGGMPCIRYLLCIRGHTVYLPGAENVIDVRSLAGLEILTLAAAPPATPARLQATALPEAALDCELSRVAVHSGADSVESKKNVTT